MATIRVKKVGKQGVSPVRKQGTVQQTTGFGYVLIPEGVDRDKFVDTCFRTNKISIIDDSEGNVIHECFISNEALQNITFPRKVGEKGTPVMWIAQSYMNQPMIIGTFISTNGRIPMRSDEEFSILREWDKGSLCITGSAKRGTLFISIRGQQFGTLKINALGDENALLEVGSTGTVKVSANKKVEVEAFEELTAKLIDPVTENESGISINKEEMTVSATYGEGDDKNFSKTTITEQGFVTETKVGETQYNHTVNENKAETTIFDCTLRFEDKKATLSQGDAMIEIRNGKMSIINGGTGLNELLTKIVDAIATLTVSTAVGPSGTPLPPTIQKTTELNGLLKQFFNK
jgi:hypothetical protein